MFRPPARVFNSNSMPIRCRAGPRACPSEPATTEGCRTNNCGSESLPSSVLPCVLSDDDIDQRRAVLLHCPLERRLDGVGLLDSLAEDAERVGKPREVQLRSDQLGAHLGGQTNSF